MLVTSILRCANLRTLGLDVGRTYTSAEIKSAFLSQAKSAHPDAGGDAERFRQLKDAYDALRSRASEPAAGAGWTSAYTTTRSNAAPPGGASERRAHIFEERSSADGRGGGGTWDYGSGRRYANESTRHFYRPYTANYRDPRTTGFTREEVARAEWAMRRRIIRRVLWNLLVYGSAVYLLCEYWRGRGETRSRDSEEPTFARAEAVQRREQQLRRMQPELHPGWTEAQIAQYLEEWNEYLRDRELAVAHDRRATTPSPVSRASAGGASRGATTAPSSDAHVSSTASSSAVAVQPAGVVPARADMHLDMSDEDDLIDEEL
ncbi:DnaJ domain containing protein [Novymonas esmeraldas]|uniref:DnaJ domain containing protein n=1 Tax=Novymonas esmeraldas TaxID=1808958 RepID=A0AAW0EU81_9TRYP